MTSSTSSTSKASFSPAKSSSIGATPRRQIKHVIAGTTLDGTKGEVVAKVGVTDRFFVIRPVISVPQFVAARFGSRYAIKKGW